tara:strand:+ start:296 stop:646 length:351 start_codon:yes stop_codon:yes gene_type:complete
MPNKHFCQGPHCHTYPTADRFLKSKGIIRGRYAYAKIDQTETRWGYRFPDNDKYFCSQSCKFDWLNEWMSAIENGRPVYFIRERRITEGYEKATEESYGRKYHTIRKISVDNNAEQ